jgi:hypothetical protein
VNEIEIKELNEREPSVEALIELTDNEIGNLNTRELREWATTVELSDYASRNTIATLPLDDVMINTAGALPAVEKFITVIKMAYSGQDPIAIKRYENVEIKVWASDDTLRRGLKDERIRLRNKRDEDDADG